MIKGREVPVSIAINVVRCKISLRANPRFLGWVVGSTRSRQVWMRFYSLI